MMDNNNDNNAYLEEKTQQTYYKICIAVVSVVRLRDSALVVCRNPVDAEGVIKL